MRTSQPRAEQDDATAHQPTIVSAKAADCDTVDLDIGHMENHSPDEGTEVGNTRPIAVGEGPISEPTQSIAGESDDDRDASADVDFAISLMEECKTNLSLSNLDNVIFLFRHVLEQSTVSDALHSHALWGLATALGLRFVHTKHQANLVEFLELNGRMPEKKSPIAFPSKDEDDSDIIGMLQMAQTSLTDLFKSTPHYTINTIIFLLQESLEVLSFGHPKRRLAIQNLVDGMYMQFHHSIDVSNVHRASIFHCFQHEYEDSSDSSKKRAAIQESERNIAAEVELVSLLGYARRLIDEFDTSGNIDDLEKGISLTQSGLGGISRNSPNYAICLHNLAVGLSARFKQQGDGQDLDKAISFHREATKSIPPPHLHYSGSLYNLALSLSDRFKLRSGIQDLNEAISLYREILELFPPSRPEYSRSLSNLANALTTRFNQRGDVQDLEESISLHRHALKLSLPSHPNFSSLLDNLADALDTRFEHRGDDKDINEGIALHRQAIELRAPPHLGSCRSLNNLAVALWTRFLKQGNDKDLNESVSFHRQALELFPPTDPERGESLNNLALSLRTRFQQQGDILDLDDSILFYREAIELFLPSHPNFPRSLSNLAGALRNRFEQRSDISDLNESISLYRQAVELFHPLHTNRPTLFLNLAVALWTRFRWQSSDRDLHESISFFKEALELFPPSHPNRSGALHNLAAALQTRFRWQGDAQDLNESISFLRQAIELRPSSHPDHPSSLNNLAITLTTRFKEEDNARDIEEAILFHKQALGLRPSPHPERSTSLNNLAITLMARVERRGDVSYLEQAMSLFSEATHPLSQSISARFRNARIWADYAELYQHPSAIDAFIASLGILPELASINLDIQSRQDSMTNGTDGLARRAARCAIRIGNMDKAVEFLETGRSVCWSQFLSLRSPFDLLHEVAPHFEKDLYRISQELEKASYRDKSIGTMTNRQRLSWETEAKQFERLAKEWKTTIDSVRDLHGFEDFLEPPKLSKLQTAAEGGPVIYLVANDDTSSCLIMTLKGVNHIPLPKLSTRVLQVLVKVVQMAASEYLISRSVIEGMVENWSDLPQPFVWALQRWRDEEDDERGMRPERHIPINLTSDDIFRLVLRILWCEVVKPVIDFLGLEKSSKPPTLTWCTTGLFSFLPIHAAGCYDEGLVDCASDYIISTYTPTIGALLTPDPPPVESFKMMAVIESSSLPSTREELRKIERHVPRDSLIKFGTTDSRASVEVVASHLSAASIVHFACHGKQNSMKPLESGLEIGDERLTISRIMKQSVPNGSLAFLSACETAMGDENIPDEAMSIGASLLFTGFRSVVATMWKMWDEDGPVIADAFYRELFKGPDGRPMPLPDTSTSAEALTIAVNELRARGVPFKRWVPFIHMGK